MLAALLLQDSRRFKKNIKDFSLAADCSQGCVKSLLPDLQRLKCYNKQLSALPADVEFKIRTLE